MRVWEALRESVRWRVYLLSLPAQVWAGMMLAMAVTPDLGPIEAVQLFEHQDKVFHVIEYFVLSNLIAFAVIRGTDLERGDQLKVSFLVPAVYGVLLEALQPLVPYRDASGLDALANILGAAIGAALAVYLLGPRFYRKD
jgi:VanZ family protein